MISNKKTRLRFAPSPTGPLTLGNARTALFNWVYARRKNGKFLLRIEDTDKDRSEKKYEKNILEGLRWLGLDWDEEIVRQSERTDIYEGYIEKLLEESRAYYCFCTKEELEQERQAQLNQGLSPTYSGKCRDVGLEEAEKRLNKDEDAVIRFKMPDGKITFKDLVRGNVEFDGELIGDFVIAKDEKSPLYNFAVVVDDYEMNVTHVVRGEDHVSNTPKQIAVQKALDLPEPTYAHLPLLLGEEGKKLSKRMLKKSLLDYRSEGYLPHAMFNFLLLMGWHPKEDREVVTREEAVKEFDLKRVQKSGAALNEEKLDWYNSQYIKDLGDEELLSHMKEFIPEEWFKEKQILKGALEAEKERITKLSDFRELGSFFFELPDYESDLPVWKDDVENSYKNLKLVADFLKDLSDEEFTSDNIKPYLEDLSDKAGGRGVVYWPLRAALSGKEASPGATEIIEVLPPEEVLNRINTALLKMDGLSA